VKKTNLGPEYDIWFACHEDENLAWPIFARNEEKAIQTVRNWASK